MESAPTYGDRRALGHFDSDDDEHRIDPARRALMERDDRGRSSPQSDDRMKGLDRSHYSPQREKRGRTLSNEEPRRTKRARRWRGRHRSRSQSSQSEREQSAELMPRVGHHNSGDGRLSYWDDGYNDVKMSGIISSEESRRLLPAVHHPSDRLAAEIQRLYPYADADWARDMASFDVDDFFRGLEAYRSAVGTVQIEQDARMEMNFFDDEDEGQSLPRVRLPPAQGNFTNSSSKMKTFVYEHVSRKNDTEDRNWYDPPEGDRYETSHVHNGEIVVNLPLRARAAPNMDSFSAQLKVNSPPQIGPNPQGNPKATNDKSERPPKDVLSSTDDGGVGQETMMLLDG